MCYKSRYVTVISAYKVGLAEKHSCYHKQLAMHCKAIKCNALKYNNYNHIFSVMYVFIVHHRYGFHTVMSYVMSWDYEVTQLVDCKCNYFLAVKWVVKDTKRHHAFYYNAL